MKEYTFEVREYGKSMYGGWYANYNSKERKPSGFPKIISGIRTRTLRELKQALKYMNADMSNSYREDH